MRIYDTVFDSTTVTDYADYQLACDHISNTTILFQQENIGVDVGAADLIRKLYPGGRKKAFNVTFDDGVTQDVRFVRLLNQYGLKGTFNLNYELTEQEFEWIHESGVVVKRLPAWFVVDLYDGHEIASHSLTHPSLDHMSEEAILYELGHDKWCLSQLFGREIVGFGVPFDYYDEHIADCARTLGFEYVRTSEESYSYVPPKDPYFWAAGTYHVMPGFYDFVEGFFDTDEELALCQIVGHSYDLDIMDLWDYYENLFRRVSDDPDVAPMTNLDLVRYLKAMDSAVITDFVIENCSDMDLWFEIHGVVKCLGAGECFRMDKE